VRYKCLSCGKTADELGWRENEDGRDYCFCVKCGIEDPPIEFIEDEEEEPAVEFNEDDKLTKEQFDNLFDSGWRKI
jgi:Zn ribbon nucleic-acid-binding protein